MPRRNKRKLAASAAEVDRERRMHGGGLAAYWGKFISIVKLHCIILICVVFDAFVL